MLTIKNIMKMQLCCFQICVYYKHLDSDFLRKPQVEEEEEESRSCASPGLLETQSILQIQLSNSRLKHSQDVGSSRLCLL